jgi:hypothetical protein
MPKILDIFGYKVYFWSNENDPLEPVHGRKNAYSTCNKNLAYGKRQMRVSK